MASTLHYLTVQDILWINLQATKKVHHFNYAKLEEATYYQYAYGESNTLLPQAARFVSGFLRLHPLEEGNEVTIFIALLAFLRINGYEVDLTDGSAQSWFGDLTSKRKSASDSIRAIALHSLEEHHGEPNVRGEIQNVLNAFPSSVLALSGASVAAGRA